MTHQQRLRLIRGLIAFNVCLVMVSLLIRYLARPAPSDSAATLEAHPEALFPSGTDYIFDVTGLYEGASSVRLRVGDNRLIEPVAPDSSGQLRVLFLGGSTTEALYVPETERWVAQLNGDGISTYNAGKSGSNSADKLRSFDYLTRNGETFDVVVISTAINDAGWTWRLGTDLGTENALQWEIDWLRAKLPQIIKSSVVETYRANMAIGTRQLESCAGFPSFLQRYQRNVEVNLGALRAAVEASGASLVVMSEASGFGAPSDSFFIDLRSTPLCDDQPLALESAERYMRRINEVYLQVAQDLGLPTIDLASAMAPLTNGPNGGTYTYDGNALYCRRLTCRCTNTWPPVVGLIDEPIFAPTLREV